MSLNTFKLKIGKYSKQLRLIILSCFLSNSVLADSQDKELPGNSQLPSSKTELQALANLAKGTYKYSVEDYFQRPKQSTFRFSPDGNYISYREKDSNSKRHIFVKNTFICCGFRWEKL